MKQLNITLLLTLLMSILGPKALAYDAYVDGIYYNFSDTEAEVTYLKYQSSSNSSAYSGSVIIPETVAYNGITYSVTSIGEFAFYRCSSLTSISILNSVISIGSHAFQNCI